MATLGKVQKPTVGALKKVNLGSNVTIAPKASSLTTASSTNSNLTPKQQDYVKNLGYTPQVLPSYYSERQQGKTLTDPYNYAPGTPIGDIAGDILGRISNSAGSKQVLDAFSRLWSGAANVVDKNYDRSRQNIIDANQGKYNPLNGAKEGLLQPIRTFTDFLGIGSDNQGQGFFGDQQKNFAQVFNKVTSDPQVYQKYYAPELKKIDLTKTAQDLNNAGNVLPILKPVSMLLNVPQLTTNVKQGSNVLETLNNAGLALQGKTQGQIDPNAKVTGNTFVSDPSVQSLVGFGLETAMDPTNLIAGFTKAAVGKGATALSKTSTGMKVIDAVKKGIAESDTAQKVLSNVVYGYGKTPQELQAFEKLAVNQGLKNDLQAGIYKVARAEKLSPQQIADMSAAAEISFGKATSKEFIKSVEDAQKIVGKLGKGVARDQYMQDIFDKYVQGLPLTKTEEIIVKPFQTLNSKGIAPKLVEQGLLTKEQLVNPAEYLKYGYKDVPSTVTPVVQMASGGQKIGKEAGLLKQRLPDSELAANFVQSKGLDPVLLQDPKQVANLALQARKEMGLVNKFDVASARATGDSLSLSNKTDLLTSLNQEGRTFDSLDAIQASGQNYKRFEQLPASDAYGALKGKFVPQAVAQDLKGIITPKQSTLDKITNAWKQVKLFSPFNTATVARNQYSAIIQNDMLGYPITEQLANLPDAFKEVYKGGSNYQLAKRMGLFGGGSNSIVGDVAREYSGQAQGKLGKVVSGALDKFTEGKSFGPLGYGKTGFQTVENANKLNMFMYQIRKGKTAEEAMKIAQDAMYNYSQAPRIVNELGRSAIPFLQFKYFATKQLVDTLINNPAKLGEYYRTKNLLESFSSSQANERDLPQWIKDNRDFVVRTPFKDKNGNTTYFDASNLVPFGNVVGGMTGSDAGSNLILDTVLANPLIRTGVEAATNQSLYFGTPIYNETKDLPGEKAQKMINYVAGQLSPKTPLNPLDYTNQKLLSAITGQPDSAGRTNTIGDVLPNMIAALKLNSVNPTKQASYNKYLVDQQVKDLNTRIKSINKNTNLSTREKQDKINEIKLYQQQLKKDSGYYGK